MPKVLISDPIAPEGVELLGSKTEVDEKHGLKPPELLETIGNYDALVVRSETKVTPEVIKAGNHLRVIARAGIGVDNIDLDAATSAGIAVVNAPIGNTVAAAEHSVALMLALSRNIPQAYGSLKQGEWRRSAFMGVEVRDKALGVVGLGRVGTEVARRARSFGMRILAYDPFVSPDYARRLNAELLPLEELLAQSDFVTLHTPLTPSTTNLIGARELSLIKPGARLINVARGELVDEAALLDALNADRLAGAALDVFVQEPPENRALVEHPKVIATPHLGASTEEAQREVAIEAAEQVLAILEGRPARNTVNAPFLPPDVHDILSPYIPVATMLGTLLTGIAEDQYVGVTIVYEGEIAEHDTALLKAAVLSGLFTPISSDQVNLINAPVLAQERGLSVTEQKHSVAPEYASLLTVTLKTTKDDITLAGTSLRDEPHLVKVNGYWLDVVPSVPYLLFVDNQDQPGSIGAVGTVAGKHNINISFMEVGRLSLRGRAMMVLGLDDSVPPNVLKEIIDLPQIYDARLVKM
ncbi:MAG: phosphoglycerate dehydrogenase [Dehalococcoidia bacterium]